MAEIALVMRVLAALVFLTAALGKLGHRLAFQGVVANYRLLPEMAVSSVALLLPPLEVAIGVALLFAPGYWAEVSGAALLVLFAGAMAINIARGRRQIDCGCFQSAQKQSLSWILVARNGALALLLAAAAAAPPGELPAAAAAEALLTGAVLFVLLQTMNILWSVVPAWRLRAAVATGAGK